MDALFEIVKGLAVAEAIMGGCYLVIHLIENGLPKMRLKSKEAKA